MAELLTQVMPTIHDEPNRGERTVLPGQTPEGQHILSILLKRTYKILPGQVCILVEEDNPLNPGDVYWDDPMNSSVKFESDFVPFKLATDIVLNGNVYVPDGKPIQRCSAALQINDRCKRFNVIGDRVAQYAGNRPPVFTDPKPFTQMELRYERAYGGIDVYSEKSTHYPYPRNICGRGFVVKNTQKSVNNLPLPNFEDEKHLLTPETLCIEDYKRWETLPYPAGFGWISKSSYPRGTMAGIMPADRNLEQKLRQAYAQFVPKDMRDAYVNNGIPDMNFRFFNGASYGLSHHFLKGGEEVRTENLSPHGYYEFKLPYDNPRLGLDIGEGMQKPEVFMQTVMIHMDERLVDIVWRGAVPYAGPDWLPEMKKMEVLVE